jgi:ABC-type bacteriocin/lantibiotic exporter with double-glycine peptidase domain
LTADFPSNDGRGGSSPAGKLRRQLRRFLPYLKPYTGTIIGGSFLLLVVSLLALPAPAIMKRVVDDVLPQKKIGQLHAAVLLLFAVQSARVAASYSLSQLFSSLSIKVLGRIKGDLFARLLRLPLSFYDRNQTGYLVSRLGEIEGLGILFSSATLRIMVSFLEIAFCLSILLSMNVKITILSLAVLPAIFLWTKSVSRNLRRLSRDALEKGAHLMRRVQETLSGVDTVKVFGGETRENARYQDGLEDFNASSLQRAALSNLSSEVLMFIAALGGLLILWLSGMDIIRGEFSLGGYIAFSAYLAKMYGPTQLLAGMGLTIQPAMVALDRFSELMDIVPEDPCGGRTLEAIRGPIEFRDIAFSYGERPVLRSVSLRIEQGEKIILAGPNGSGKSTLMKILLGLYPDYSGEVLIDGCDIRSISKQSLRERISVISQNVFLFNDTIWNNILYSRPDASEQDIARAAAASGVSEFAGCLPRGFQTVIGERGVMLSGGERQRIAIARALLKNADLFIFDEATTHLDQDTENRLAGFIRENIKDRTCIIITHKTWPGIPTDRTYELRNGGIEIRPC